MICKLGTILIYEFRERGHLNFATSEKWSRNRAVNSRYSKHKIYFIMNAEFRR